MADRRTKMVEYAKRVLRMFEECKMNRTGSGEVIYQLAAEVLIDDVMKYDRETASVDPIANRKAE